MSLVLAAKTETADDLLIFGRIVGLKILEVAPSAADHQQESPTGMNILGELLEVFSKLIDALREDGHLDLNRSGIIT